MRETMTPETLRKKQIEFIAIGVVGIIAVGIFAALDAGNDLGEVLVGLVQFLLMVGVAVGVYFNRHRFLRPVQPKAAAPDAPRTVATAIPQREPETRLALVAPNRHQSLTFDGALQALEGAVYELAQTADLPGKVDSLTRQLESAQNQLLIADQVTQRAVDAAVAAAQQEWEAQRAALEQRHTTALLLVEQERDRALATATRTSLPDLLVLINAALEGKLSREITKTVAQFSNKDYGPFAQSVREAITLRFAPPSPVLEPLILSGETTVKNDLNGHPMAGEGTLTLGRTEAKASDGPTDEASDGAIFPIVLYNAEFARIVTGAPPEVIYDS